MFNTIRLEEAPRNLMIYDKNSSLVMSARLGVMMPHNIHPYKCLPHGDHYRSDVKCLEWPDRAVMTMTKLDTDDNDDGVTCHRVVWTSLTRTSLPRDCWPLSAEHHWYGGGETLASGWPHQGQFGMTPFVTGDGDRTVWGNVIRKYWLNSRGVSITVSDDTPLSVSLNQDPNNPSLCLQV